MLKTFDLEAIVSGFLTPESVSVGQKPIFALVTGITGAGKTTIRKKKYGRRFVHLDAGDITVALNLADPTEGVEETEKRLQAAGREIARRAVAERRNLVVEIIGERLPMAKGMLDAMLAAGYTGDLTHVECDPVESYKRHIKAVQTDPSYISSYFTQDSHHSWLVEATHARPVTAEPVSETFAPVQPRGMNSMIVALLFFKARFWIIGAVSAGIAALIWNGVESEGMRFFFMLPFAWGLVYSLIKIFDPQASKGLIRSVFFWFVVAAVAGMAKLLLQ